MAARRSRPRRDPARLAPLPRLRDRDDAYRLFLAETALDAGVSPAALLAELGYAACTPLLKFDPNQPRVPAGSGEQSGRWTSGGAGGEASGTAAGQESREPAREGTEEVRPTPVLFPDGPKNRERTSPEAEWRQLDIGRDEKLRIQEGRPVLSPSVGAGVPVPVPRPAPTARPNSQTTGAGSSGIAIPEPGITPIPRLQSAPVDPDPASSTPTSSGDRGFACPAPQNDRPNGPNPTGDEFEYRMSLLINPSNPTPKNSMATPNVISQAYYLPSPTPDGKTSFDDCKKDNTPTVLPIPGLKPGDMFEHKAGAWGWQLLYKNSAGYQQIEKQVRNQNAAVVLEGRGRQIYYCLGNVAIVNKARKEFGHLYSNSHFLVCH